MSNEKKDNISNFINEIPVKLDANEQISLYNLLKKKCPQTIKLVTDRIEGKKKNLFSKTKNENKDRWYTYVVNYLTKSNVLCLDKDNNNSKHLVEDEWEKYFVYPASNIYSLENLSNHLILYRQTAIEFLKKTGILDENGNEIISEKPKKGSKNIFSKYAKQIKIVMNIIFFLTIINFILMISKYGLKDITPFLSNTCLFTFAAIMLSTGSENK